MHHHILALAVRDDRPRRSADGDAGGARDAVQLRRVKALVDHSPDVMYLTDATGTLVYASPAAERILGHRSDPSPWARLELVHPDDVETVASALTTSIATGNPSETLVVRVRDVRGIYRRFEVVVTSLLDDPDVAGILVHAHDVTEREAAIDVLRRAFEDAAIGMALLALDGRYLQANEAFCALLGYTPEEMLSMRYVDLTHPDDVETSLELVDRALAGERPTYQVEKRYVHRDGHVVWTQIGVSLVRDTAGEPQYFVVQALDITDRKRLEDQLAHDATHDVLTGLATRSLLFDRLDHAIAAARRYDGRVGLLFIDLDGFKSVNDTYGHAIGDTVLVEVARRMTDSVREIDTACRFGGDEFVVVCPHLDQPGDAIRVAERIGSALAMPFPTSLGEVQLGASIGVAIGDRETDAADLLHRADAASYSAKQKGGGGWALLG